MLMRERKEVQALPRSVGIGLSAPGMGVTVISPQLPTAESRTTVPNDVAADTFLSR